MNFINSCGTRGVDDTWKCFNNTSSTILFRIWVVRIHLYYYEGFWYFLSIKTMWLEPSNYTIKLIFVISFFFGNIMKPCIGRQICIIDTTLIPEVCSSLTRLSNLNWTSLITWLVVENIKLNIMNGANSTMYIN